MINIHVKSESVSQGNLTDKQVAMGFDGDTIRISEVRMDRGYQRAKGVWECSNSQWDGKEVTILHLLENTDKIYLKAGKVYPRSIFRPLRELNWDNPFKEGVVSIVNSTILDLYVHTESIQ